MMLLEPFQYTFFVNGIIAATLIGLLTGLVGVFIVLRRMSYIGHGLSHSIFGGAVVSYIMQWNFYIGATIWGFVSGLLINRITQRQRIGSDAAIGIVTTASFAIGVALISKVRHFTRNFEAALFGNVLGVTQQDLLIILITSFITFLVIFLTFKKLVFLTFDRETASAFGVNISLLDLIFSMILTLTIIVSIQVMGVTLIAASVVIPPSIARLLTNSFNKMILLSTIIGGVAGFVGVYLSFYLDVASGATVVLTSTFCFIVVSFFKSHNIKFLMNQDE